MQPKKASPPPILLGWSLLLSLGTLLATDAQALPAFARQTGSACMACHTQHFPAINAYGRMFKASGFTMTGSTPGGNLIEGDLLSLPSVLNAALVAKLQYNKTNGNTGTGTDYGQITWPGEASLLFGGKVGNHMGGVVEIGLAYTPVNGTATAVIGPPGQPQPVTGSGVQLLSSKINFNVFEYKGNQLTIVPFSTDALSPSYGFEMLNTGAVNNQIAIENSPGYSAAALLGTSLSAATGVAFVIQNPKYFVNYTLWTPGHAGAAPANLDIQPTGMANYFRAVVMPSFGVWDTGFGVQYFEGGAKPAISPNLVTKAFVVDAQALGYVGKFPLNLYASYGESKGIAPYSSINGALPLPGNIGIPLDATSQNLYGPVGGATDPLTGLPYGSGFSGHTASAFGALAQLGIIPNRMTLFLAYSSVNYGNALLNNNGVYITNGTTYASGTQSYTLGTTFLFAQNIRMDVWGMRQSGSAINSWVTNPTQVSSALGVQLFVAF